MRQIRKRNRTQTSTFGVSGRISHDSRKFYKSRLYAGQSTTKHEPYVENAISANFINQIFCKSSEVMNELPDNSIHLMVTSPPYNVGKEYDQDLTLSEYRELLRRVLKESYRVLVKGGRVCFNVANLGRKPYIPLHTYVIEDSLDAGFAMRGEIIWDKASSASSSTAWGSWKSASNPTLRDQHEYILIFSKDDFSRSNPAGRKDTISREEFLEFTRSVWKFPAESATRIGHPAPFPVELPYRCIQLYTFENEVVLDPFCGSGSACVAAVAASRNFVAYETDSRYIEIANRRISERVIQQKNSNADSYGKKNRESLKRFTSAV